MPRLGWVIAMACLAPAVSSAGQEPPAAPPTVAALAFAGSNPVRLGAAEARVRATLGTAATAATPARVFVTDAERGTAEALPLVVASGVRVARFERVRPTLEDVFLALVGPTGEVRS